MSDLSVWDGCANRSGLGADQAASSNGGRRHALKSECRECLLGSVGGEARHLHSVRLAQGVEYLPLYILYMRYRCQMPHQGDAQEHCHVGGFLDRIQSV